MASVHVNIKPKIWQWIEKQIADMQFNSATYNKLNTWIDGSKLPTFKQIEDFSKKTGIPLGYFFLNVPPKEDLDLLAFRTVDSEKMANPSRELKNTVHDMENIQEWMRNYRQEDDNDTIWWIGCLKDCDVEAAARKIRKILDIEENWSENIKGAKAAFV